MTKASRKWCFLGDWVGRVDVKEDGIRKPRSAPSRFHSDRILVILHLLSLLLPLTITKAESYPIEERRIDSSDGNAYTRQEFVEYYGGEDEWQRSSNQVYEADNLFDDDEDDIDSQDVVSGGGGNPGDAEEEEEEDQILRPLSSSVWSLNDDFDLEPEKVPRKTIWGYWADGEAKMPAFYKICVETWKRQNPSWYIRILDKSSISKYLSSIELPPTIYDLPPHGASDHVRLALLAKYGGVWMDVSIILRESLDTLAWQHIERGEVPFVGIYNPVYGSKHLENKDFVESWFLATARHNPFVYRWRDLLSRLFKSRTTSGFASNLLTDPLYEGLDLSNFLREGVDFREYLAIHVMLRRILENESDLRSQWESWKLYSTEDTGLRLQRRVGDWGISTVEALFSSDDEIWRDIASTPLMKFTTPANSILQKLPREMFFSKGTLIQRILSEIGLEK